MTDDACPTCGPICGIREFGWEKRQQGYAERLHDEALGIDADLDEWTSPAHLQLATIRNEYARYVDSGDMHEFVRAVRQVLDQRDDVLDPPIVVPRPEQNTDGRMNHLIRAYRRWLLEEATSNQGATVETTVAPTASTDVWRYPYWPKHDVAWEDE